MKLIFGDPTAIKMAQGAVLNRSWTEESLKKAKWAVEKCVHDLQGEGFDVEFYDSTCEAGNNHPITIEISPYEEWVSPEVTA